MRNEYNKNLTNLNDDIIKMGSLIETAIARSITSLRKKDTKLAEEVTKQDYVIDTKEKEIASSCVTIALLQQPVASDLRLITAATRIISDMERIGDHATDICENILQMQDYDYLPYIDKISIMADKSIEMLNLSIDSYTQQNVELADQVREMDNTVDELFDNVKAEMSDVIRQYPSQGMCMIDLIMIAKYFERIADHSVNIANWTEFCKTGYYKNARII